MKHLALMEGVNVDSGSYTFNAYIYYVLHVARPLILNISQNSSVRVTVGQGPPSISLYFAIIFVNNILSKTLSCAVFVYHLQSSEEFVVIPLG